MSSKRCYGCKCLEEESSIQFYARTKSDPKARFFCRKCKKQPPPEAPIRKRVAKVAKVKRASFQVSDEECRAMGKFYRLCPLDFKVSYIIPLNEGGRRDFSNLQYVSIDEADKKEGKRFTKMLKTQIFKTHPFTPMPEGVEQHQVQVGKAPRVSKYKRVRRLSRKSQLQKAT